MLAGLPAMGLDWRFQLISASEYFALMSLKSATSSSQVKVGIICMQGRIVDDFVFMCCDCVPRWK